MTRQGKERVTTVLPQDGCSDAARDALLEAVRLIDEILAGNQLDIGAYEERDRRRGYEDA